MILVVVEVGELNVVVVGTGCSGGDEEGDTGRLLDEGGGGCARDASPEPSTVCARK